MKLKLDSERLVDSFFDDAVLLGIVAPLRNYKFIWQINEQMGLCFRLKYESEIIFKRKERYYYFNVYEYKEKSCSIEHFLYHNEDGGEYLLPEFKHLDYMWLIKGDIIDKDSINVLQANIKALQGVQLVSVMPDGKIKNKEHLIL